MPVPVAEILEVALASLIAYRAIQWMMNEQEFKDILARLLYARRICLHDVVKLAIKLPIGWSGSNYGGASRRQLTVRNNLAGGREKHVRLYKAHAAVRRTAQSLMIAVVRHLNAVQPCCLDNIDSIRNFNFKVIQFDKCHDFLKIWDEENDTWCVLRRNRKLKESSSSMGLPLLFLVKSVDED